MSWRNTALLFLLVVAALAVAYRDVVVEDPEAGWDAVFDEPLPTPPSADVQRLVDFDPKSVVAMSLESEGVSAQTRRTARGWTATSQPRRIDAFLDNLRDLAVILAIDEEPTAEDLAGFGLREPRARIRLERADGSDLVIELGAHNPSTTAIYTRVSGRPGVALTGAVAVWDLSDALAALGTAPAPPD